MADITALERARLIEALAKSRGGSRRVKAGMLRWAHAYNVCDARLRKNDGFLGFSAATTTRVVKKDHLLQLKEAMPGPRGTHLVQHSWLPGTSIA
jgi:hypothetical protein